MRMNDRLLITLILMMSMFAPLSTDMFLPSLDEMVEYFGTTESTFSMALYLFMFFLALGILFLGPTSDKYGRRKVCIASLSLYIAASFACSFAPTIEVLIAMRILQAIGAGGAMAVSVALIRDCFTGERRSKVLKIVAIIGILGPVLAPIIGQALIWAVDWHATFWAPAIVALAALGLTVMLPANIPEQRYEGSIAGAVATIGPILRNGEFRRFTVMMTMVTFCVLAYVSVSEYIYKDKGFGVGDMYSIYLASAMILGVLAMMCLEKLKLSRKDHLKLFFALMAVATVLMWTVADRGPLIFMVAVIPMIATSSLARSFGFDVLLSQDVGNSGAISSVLNFSTFMFATAGMIVVVNLPFDNYITSVAACFTIYLAVYTVLWVRMVVKGTTLKGLE